MTETTARHTVLLVDDSPANLARVLESLEREGHMTRRNRSDSRMNPAATRFGKHETRASSFLPRPQGSRIRNGTT
ncbi:hypothetical protein JCM17961_41010 [Endothiovibrio diazotrophicus]